MSFSLLIIQFNMFRVFISVAIYGMEEDQWDKLETVYPPGLERNNHK